MKEIYEKFKLKTNFLGIELESPLVLPAGIMDLSFSGMKYAVEKGAGIVTSKSLTLNPRKGHSGPVVAEFDGGMLNSMGLCNPGIEAGIIEIDTFKEKTDKPLIISIFGTDAEEFKNLIEIANSSKADFIELNLSCPNVFDEFGIPLSASNEKVYEIVTVSKEVSKKPLIAKLSPNVYDIKKIALSAEEAGVDALCLINTLGPGMLIDIKMRKPVLQNIFGGLSGPCVKPIALKLVYETYSTVQVPIIGTGGINTGKDAVEMLMSGSALIGVGTAVKDRGIDVFTKINNEIVNYLEENNLGNINEIERLTKLS